MKVKCKICGKTVSRIASEIHKNKTGNFYCGKECLKIGHSKSFSGANNYFYGKKHSPEQIEKITGKNHWNYGNRTAKMNTVICKNCGKEFEWNINKYRKEQRGQRQFCSRECRYTYNKSTRIQRKCAWCGKLVEKVTYYANQKYIFCSTECFRKGQQDRVKIVCEVCGKEFQVIASRSKTAHYCSNECYWQSGLSNTEIESIKEQAPEWSGGQTIEMTCQYCEKVFETSVKLFLQGRRFCSQDCYILAEIWNDGSSFEPYTPKFNRQLKELIRHRDGYKCQKCGCPEIEEGKKLSVHHIDYIKKNCEPNNLITLCGKCHSKVNRDRQKWTKYFQRKVQRIMDSNSIQLNFRFKKNINHNLQSATTILKGSTLQANGSGSAEYPDKRDNDIVCSCRKLQAVHEDGLDIANPDEH